MSSIGHDTPNDLVLLKAEEEAWPETRRIEVYCHSSVGRHPSLEGFHPRSLYRASPLTIEGRVAGYVVWLGPLNRRLFTVIEFNRYFHRVPSAIGYDQANHNSKVLLASLATDFNNSSRS